MQPMVLLGDEAQVEARFSTFADSANLDAILMPGLRQTYLWLEKSIERTRWNSYVMWVMWKLVLVCLEIVLTLTQDMCTVCAERSANLDARYVHSLCRTYQRLENHFGRT
jgi:hypothetical protein